MDNVICMKCLIQQLYSDILIDITVIIIKLS